MKAIVSLLFFLINLICFSQENNEIEKLKKYKTYEVINYPNPKNNWSYKYQLENGRIIEQENYESKTLAYKCKYLYDTINHKEYIIELYNRNDGYKNDSIIKKETIHIKKIINDGKILNKDEFSLIEKYGDSIWKFQFEYKYDSQYNIIEKKITDVFIEEDSLKNKIKNIEIETISYKFDKFNNVIELHRSFNNPVEFPIPYGGGRLHYEKENFRYVYNKNALWVKKFWIVNGKETLIEKRKFYK
jgi:hypothetical protein